MTASALRRPTRCVGAPHRWRATAAVAVMRCAALLSLPAFPAHADDLLTLSRAQDLAVRHQPVLEGLQAEARAARASAIAARQLPDPQLTAGLADLPIDSGEAGSLTQDSDTQLQLGLSQSFPRAAKRRLRGQLGDQEGQALDAQAELAEREIRRDVALAWLQRWKAERTLALALDIHRQSELQAEAARIALRTDTATQADVLRAQLEAGRAADAIDGAEQDLAHAKSLLSRWITDAAEWPLDATPRLAPPPTLGELIARIELHPALRVWAAKSAVAQSRSALARAAYTPDWRLELGYGNRPAYSDMVSLSVGIDLPVFTPNRQDRELESALAQQDAAEFSIEDGRRQLVAELRLNHHDWQRLDERLRRYDAALIPQEQQRIEAARVAWRSGSGALVEVLEAQRSLIELQLSRLDLQADAFEHALQLRYLDGTAADAAPRGDTHE